MTENYVKIEHYPKLPQYVVQEGLRSIDDYTFIPEWSLHIKNAESFLKTSYFAKLKERFDNVEAKYVRYPSYSYYNWHTDLRRNLALIWVIQSDPVNAMTLFKKEGSTGSLWDIEKVDYELFKPVILNVNVPHCIINNSAQERYIFQVTVLKPYTYEEVKEFLISLQFTDY